MRLTLQIRVSHIWAWRDVRLVQEKSCEGRVSRGGRPLDGLQDLRHSRHKTHSQTKVNSRGRNAFQQSPTDCPLHPHS
jgi:hypothetical protein